MAIHLDERLSAAAKLVREGAVVCDIGTDHAYLPCALMQEGKIKAAFAMDINEGPIENAKRTVTELGLSDAVTVRLSDGLDALEAEETKTITDVIICGMGGELIDTIISRAEWLKNAEKCLILQPMTQVPYLRRQLYLRGFAIESEIPVTDKHHTYTVMRVHYAGEPQVIDEVFAHIGRIPESASSQAVHYMEIIRGRLLKAAMGMEQADSLSERAQKLREIVKGIEEKMPMETKTTVADVWNWLNAWAPFDTQCTGDNSGLQAGSMSRIVSGVVIALDCTEAVIDYAVKTGANLIITHHPLLFVPVKSVTEESLVGRLLQNGISLISAHTNLDLANGGVNDCLAAALDVKVTGCFGEDNLGRIGVLEQEMTPDDFAAFVKQKLHTALIYGAGNRAVKTVALIGGAGSDEVEAAIAAGADAYLTGEVDHNCYVDFAASGMTLLAGGHYATERVVLPEIKARFLKAFAHIPAQVLELDFIRSI